MIGRFEISNATFMTDESGNMTAAFTVEAASRYACKETIAAAKRALADSKQLVIKVDEKRNKRTLDQNALMWALLTIYAEEDNGGRTGGTLPEDVYYRMIDKYGKATFLMTLPEAESELKKVYRVVKKVDVRNYDGQELIIYKCYCGSSKYTTKEMTNLIDGIFDELAKLGISEKNYVAVESYRNEWNTK